VGPKQTRPISLQDEEIKVQVVHRGQVKAQKEDSHLRAEERNHKDTMTMDFQHPKLWKIHFYCLSCPVCGILLPQS
jgi:ABC-type histidine transport system ATPase subunit